MSPRAFTVGRYTVHAPIASGGMATVHVGRLAGPVGFARTVAVKRLHAELAHDPEFVAMLLDEARLCARVRHPNVVGVLDVLQDEGELFLVLEYVDGLSLAALAKLGPSPPVPVAVRLAIDVLEGLHAAHEATHECGDPLRIVHRDVSPHNVLVGAEGVARVIDFGVAKAEWRAQGTRSGQLKGKIAYMAPEQLRGEAVDRRVDVYGAAVVLWELLAGRRMVVASEPGAALRDVLEGPVPSPRVVRPEVPEELASAVLRGLARDRDERFSTARAMAVALEAACAPATPREVGAWVAGLAASELAERAALVASIERGASVGVDRDAQTGPTASLEASSQRSLAAIAAAKEPPPRASRRSLVFGAAVLALAIAAGFGAGRARDRDPSVLAPAGRPSPPTFIASATWTAPPAEPVAIATSASAVAPSASARGNSDAPTSRVAAPRASSSAARRAPPAASARPPACDPPYTVDPEGVRVYKRECL